MIVAGMAWNGFNTERLEILTMTDDFSLTVEGDFHPDEKIFTASLIGDGRTAFALTEEISSNYEHYIWTLYHRDHLSSTSTTFYQKYVGSTVEKDEPVLYYSGQKIGELLIIVQCGVRTENGFDYPTTYTCTVSNLGTIAKEFVWEYGGKKYSAQTSFGYDEYRYYRDLNPNGRTVTDISRVTSFVTYEEPAVVMLAESLRSAYGADRDTTGKSFASFVLGFIQMCYAYPPSNSLMQGDKYMYGHDEYFAYPLETIFHGMGDCEDTAILTAALLKALGYPTGVMIVPGHALAVVGLSDYSPGAFAARSFEVLCQTIDGVTYYACETTASSPQEIGLVALFGFNGSPYSECLNESRYKAYIV